MCISMSSIYGFRLTRDRILPLLLTSVGGVGTTFLLGIGGKFIFNVMKAIPGFNVPAMILSSGVAVIVTGIIGLSFNAMLRFLAVNNKSYEDYSVEEFTNLFKNYINDNKNKNLNTIKNELQNEVNDDEDLKEEMNNHLKDVAKKMQEGKKKEKIIRTKLEQTNRELLCHVCIENPRTVTFLPCKHRPICSACWQTNKIELCPLCMGAIEIAVESYE